MTTELERRLREALHEDAARARLVNPDGPPAPEARPLLDGQHQRRPARKLVAVAAAIVLIVAAGVAVIQDREHESEVGTHDPLEEVFTDVALGDAEVFTDIPPGSTVELPPAPISEREAPALVWSGTEMIVWGGTDGDARLDDGAAFDLSTGTWRVIASAPIEGRGGALVAWTGTEMVVWGGQTSSENGRLLTDGAAYDPTTDTWRRVPEAPIDFETGAGSVWTGDELIVAGEVTTQVGEMTHSSSQMAAYNPATDEWRRLADPPRGFGSFDVPPTGSFDVLSTGEVILMTVAGIDPTTGDETNLELVRYDLSRDTWQPAGELVSDLVSYEDTGGALVVAPELIAVTDADGATRAVLVEPARTGAPIVVLDRRGNEIGTLPELPADPAKFGDLSATGGVWAGEEVLFHTRTIDSEGTFGTPEHWALNPTTQTWRPFDADAAPPAFGVQLAAEAGVFIGWGPLSSEPGNVGPVTGIVYRPPTSSGK